jgi:hypothetical protein
LNRTVYKKFKIMPNDNKTEEFLQKLAPCIERGDLDACVEEAARVAREKGGGEIVRPNLPYRTSSFLGRRN